MMRHQAISAIPGDDAMNAPIRSMVPEKPFHLEVIAPGIALRRLYPGGKAGREV